MIGFLIAELANEHQGVSRNQQAHVSVEIVVAYAKFVHVRTRQRGLLQTSNVCRLYLNSNELRTVPDGVFTHLMKLTV